MITIIIEITLTITILVTIKITIIIIQKALAFSIFLFTSPFIELVYVLSTEWEIAADDLPLQLQLQQQSKARQVQLHVSSSLRQFACAETVKFGQGCRQGDTQLPWHPAGSLLCSLSLPYSLTLSAAHVCADGKSIKSI